MKLTAEQYATISRLLDIALDLPRQSRAGWVEDQQDLDPELKSALRRMVDEPENTEFLNTLPAIAEAAAEGAPAEVGPYRLIRQLGRGGMGSVWLAERADGILKRQIALKLPHAGAAQPQLRERFERERDILAALTHPNIARLYDAGMDGGGRPFIALEFVDGIPLTAYCDRHRLRIEQRLALFLDVLSAVQYAHAHLVLHRDLKPSNILVTSLGEVKLLDFGIAKMLTEGQARETELTEIGGRALTFDYASPEQISGEPMSTASDVYSLGVVLFELLSGERPYKPRRETRAALEEAILSGETPRLAAAAGDQAKAEARGTTTKRLAAVLRGDLATIAGKAIARNQARRYATADAFAQDLRRYLAGEAVLARPESSVYRARKFILRHKLPVAACAAVILALAAGLGVALWQARVAHQEARTSAAVEKFLTDIFRANSSDQANPAKARQTTARELLDAGASKIDSELKESPEAKLRLYKTLSTLYLDLGLDDAAVKQARNRLALSKSLYGSRSPKVAEALVDLGSSMHSSQSVNEEGAVLGEAEQVLDGLRDFNSLTRARLCAKLAEFYYGVDLRKAVENARQAVRIFHTHPPSPELVEALYGEGILRNQLAQYSEALPLFREAIQDSRKLEGDPNPALPRLYAIQAQAQEARLHFADAEQSLRSALAEARAVNGEDHVDTVQTEMRLGIFLSATSHHAEALQNLRAARDTVLKIRGAEDSFHTPQVLLEYGWALARSGRIEDGLASITQAVENRRKNRPGTRFLAAMLEYQAKVLTDLGDYGGAHKLLDEALLILQKTHDTTDWRNSYYRAKLLIATGKPEEAARIQQVQAEFGAADALSIESMRAAILAAELAVARKDATGGMAIASNLRERIAASPARPYMKEMEATAALLEGQAYLMAHRADQAIPPLNRAVELRAGCLDPVSPLLAEAYVALAAAYAELGSRERAVSLQVRAKAIFAAHKRLGDQYTVPQQHLALALSGVSGGVGR